MAIDPDTKVLLTTLVEGQGRHGETLERRGETLERHGEMLERHGETLERHEVLLTKLAEGQAELRQEVSQLARAQRQTDANLTRAAGLITTLADGVSQRMDRADERMQELTEAILRGFTDAANRDTALGDRVSTIERQLDR